MVEQLSSASSLCVVCCRMACLPLLTRPACPSLPCLLLLHFDLALQLRAQLEVLSAAASEKLSRLDGGDFEESDAELDAFLQELKQVRKE